MTANPTIFDRQLLARRRARIAGQAENHDFLLQRVCDDLVERLHIVKRTFPAVLNLGAHHGLLSRCLAGVPAVGFIIDADISSEARPAPEALAPLVVAADEEALPFADASLDLIVSGLSLQFVNDLPGALIQMRRALKPDGLLLAALLGGETLKELREAWLVAEDEVSGGASPRVAPFAEVRELGSLLQRAGFALPVADSDNVRVTYASPLHLMRELKAMGASNVLAARR
ncbi:MAG: methyltransferase domain-containing protein, partial [Hyphomicrobium sp.]